MKKIVFIIPYFGKFNNYFQLFLNSCAENKEIDWLIYTDDKTSYDYPKNVNVKYTTFEEIKKLFQSKFNYKISLERPYKLCDYRPLYGYLFESDITEYEYWGHCDTDLIWGDISKFIYGELKNNYDKLFFLGHCTLFKNSLKLKKFFEDNTDGNIRFKEVYTNEKNCSFDEEFKNSINNIFQNSNLKILLKEFEANIYMKSSNFNLVKYNFFKKKYYIEKRKQSVFTYEEGKIYQYYLENRELKKEEFLYIHMQSRKMEVKINPETKVYKIIPNAFENLEHKEINVSNFENIKKKNFNLHYFKLRGKNLKIKILKFLNGGK